MGKAGLIRHGFLPLPRPLLPETDRLLAETARAQTNANAASVTDDYHLLGIQLSLVWALTLHGYLGEAERLVHALLETHAAGHRPRMYVRCRCHLARTLRLQGRADEAHSVALTAVATHTTMGLFGDLVSLILPPFARLEDEPQAVDALARAERLLRDLENPMASAQVLCAKGRRLRCQTDRVETRRLCAETPAPQACAVAAPVVGEWDAWVGGADSTEPDDYGSLSATEPPGSPRGSGETGPRR